MFLFLQLLLENNPGSFLFLTSGWTCFPGNMPHGDSSWGRACLSCPSKVLSGSPLLLLVFLTHWTLPRFPRGCSLPHYHFFHDVPILSWNHHSSLMAQWPLSGASLTSPVTAAIHQVPALRCCCPLLVSGGTHTLLQATVFRALAGPELWLAPYSLSPASPRHSRLMLECCYVQFKLTGSGLFLV